MIGAEVTVVLDTRELNREVEQGASEVLMGMGANIVDTVDQSLQYRRGSSKPGQPPHVHRPKAGGASPLKAKLAFALENPLHMVAGVERGGRAGMAPRQLEEGGTITTKDGNRIRVEPRPYMRPAFELETMSVPGSFADIL